jgi:hypothetical protein
MGLAIRVDVAVHERSKIHRSMAGRRRMSVAGSVLMFDFRGQAGVARMPEWRSPATPDTKPAPRQRVQ